MKNLFIAVCVLSLISCGHNEKKSTVSDAQMNVSDSTSVQVEQNSDAEYLSFGETFTPENVLSAKEMHEKFQDLKVGDTLNLTFQSTANDVCAKKGCWMKLALPDGKESMVRFEDYSFFVPTDSKGNEFIVHGKAFITELSVEKLR
ncbi:MAG TPA: DUF4920 domain-containing protein, partial [Flavobacteriaceae bacterium]|nr:DUF4920 domain-containing protein [Flavobacteriaceae bacterium]